MGGNSQNKTNKLLVGVNYFSGWWRETPNKWQDASKNYADWRGRYPERVPTHGCFNDLETMDADIINASSYGVDYFQILWYPIHKELNIDEPHVRHINEGLSNFLKSKENGRMKFTVEYCNHPPFDLRLPNRWDEAVDYWCESFSHPSYLKINGKAVFKIHGVSLFYEQCGSESAAKHKLDDLRNKVKTKTGLDMIITSGVTQGNEPDGVKSLLGDIDFFSTYMDIPSDIEVSEKDYPYERLFAFATETAERYGRAGVAFMPYFPIGWNPRPWQDPRPSFELPNRKQVCDSVRKLVDIMDKYGCLGIPDGSGNTVKGFNIYAWNEFGEGGFLAPDIVGGFSKLEGLRDALIQ